MDSARGKALADEFHMNYFEASAKDGTGVREAFHSTARTVAQKLLELEGGAAAGVGGGKSVKQLNGKKDGKECVVQ